MPLPIKDLVRQAIADGGIPYRMADIPFLYLDKNYVKALGGVAKTMQSVKGLKEHTLVIQLKGVGHNLLREAILAAEGGGNIIMIDTGRKEDIVKIDSGLRAKGSERPRANRFCRKHRDRRSPGTEEAAGRDR